jgi:membrane associated rhomboid family serine protease
MTIEQEKPRLFAALLIPTLLVVLMWAAESFEILSGISLIPLGIYPRHWEGILGIITAPLVHSDWSHLGANTVSLFVLLAALYYFYRELASQVFVQLWFISGLWVWLGARESWHIGASGLVYGLAVFLFVSGLVRRDSRLSALSLFVVFAYGSLVWGIFPDFFPEKNISWEAHLAGLLAGLVLAIYYRQKGPKKPRYSWEWEELEELEAAANNTAHPESVVKEPEEATPAPEQTHLNDGIRVKYYYRKDTDPS